MNLLKTRLSITEACVVCVALGGLILAADSQTVAYPEGFRGWRLVKSEFIGPDSKLFATRGGIHHFWANEPALEGYRTGHFPNGSVVIDEILIAKEAEGEDRKGIFGEGERRSIDVMMKNDALYKDSDGWGFETFKGDSRAGSLTPEIRTKCHDCHGRQKARDFVFSELRK